VAIFQTFVEGNRYIALWQPTPKQVTLRFGVKAPAGTYCVAFRNFTTTRSYVAEYTIAAGEANTDVVRSVTLPATDGSVFEFGNGAGVYITWALMCGSTYRTAPNIWGTGNFMGTTNQSNFMGVPGNVFELFDVSLTEGASAPPFVVPDYADELLACKRYWTRGHGRHHGYAGAAGNAIGSSLYWNMRATPACATGYSASGNMNAGPSGVFPIAADGGYIFIVALAAGDTYASFDFTANARL